MDSNDIAIATGGVSAPLWLPAINDWVALVLGVISIVYVVLKIIKLK
jgi:hypothetical protein